MAFSSSFGQTYFIGVFGPELRAEFDLTHTAWGAIYMTGTLCSALVLPFTGKLIDRIDLRAYAGVVSVALALACVGISSVLGPITLLSILLCDKLDKVCRRTSRKRRWRVTSRTHVDELLP